MFGLRISISVLVFTVLSLTHLSGQVVNTEKKRLNSDKEGWSGGIALNINLIKNTREIVQGNTQFNLQYKKKKHRFMIMNDLGILQVNGENLLKNGFQHFRYNYHLNDWLVAEAFNQGQYNIIQMVNLRILTGAGPRVKIVHNDSLRLYVGSLYMYEYEEITGGEVFNRTHRNSTYVSFGWSFRKFVQFDNITYFQPALSDFSDFRLSSENSLSFKITKHFSFNTYFQILYDSNPPEGLQTTFYSLINGLRWDF